MDRDHKTHPQPKGSRTVHDAHFEHFICQQDLKSEDSMNHRQTIAEISKRLPRLKRRDIAEVLEVMTELWLDELAQPGQTVTVADLGKLVVEVQNFHSGGTVQQRLQQKYGS